MVKKINKDKSGTNKNQYDKAKILLTLNKVSNREAHLNKGYTLLTFAIKEGDLEMVKILLEDGAVSPDTKDGNDNVPLMFATSQYSKTRKLCKGSYKVNMVDRSIYSQIVDKILEKKPNLNIPNLLSNMVCEPEMLDTLLKAGAESTEDAQNLINLAITEGREDSLKILIKHGADVNSMIYEPEMLDKILEAGAGSTKILQNLMSLAITVGREDSLKILIKHRLKYGVDVNSVDSDGKVPLDYALKGNLNSEVMQILLKAGAEPNIQDAKGNTALTHLINNIKNDSSKVLDKLEMLSLLFKHGAEINTETSEGESAYDYLVEAFHAYLDYMNGKNYKGDINIKYEEMGRIYCEYLESKFKDKEISDSVEQKQEQIALTGEITDVLKVEQT